MSEKSLSEQVSEILIDSLYNNDEVVDDKIPKGAVIVRGLIYTFGFYPERLDSHKEQIRQILDQMPRDFHYTGGGGGWSFLNLCLDKDGNQWADHPTMEKLVVLGIGVGMVSYCLPRDMWNVLPGGVPYIVIDTKDSPDFKKCQEAYEIKPRPGNHD